MVRWYSDSLQDVYGRLDTGDKGLTEKEAEKRLRKYGRNVLKEKEKISPFSIFGRQFKSALVLVLVAAMLISLAIGHFVDASVIGAIIVINSVFGFIQEFRAERAMAALKRLAAPMATVVREDKRIRIPAAQLVPGDVIYVASGDRVPADARVVEAINLRIDESMLTGESRAVNKAAETLSDSTSLMERSNMLFASTVAVFGHGLAVVVATGMNTEVGGVAKLVEKTRVERTPLQKKLRDAAKYIGVGVFSAALVVFGLGLLRGAPIFDMFFTAVALAVAAVPEGLPAVVTITLAIGLKTMARKNAIIRRLPVAETLGDVTVICTDKTGTLTENEMTATRLYFDGRDVEVTGVGYEPHGKFLEKGKRFFPSKNRVASKLLEIARLCNIASLARTDGQWTVEGDPTEGALVVVAEKAKIKVDQYKKMGEISFDSKRKLMSTLHRCRKGVMVSVKGAPEVLLSRCVSIYVGGKLRALTKKDGEKILEEKARMASEGLRVLGFAFKYAKKIDEQHVGVEKDLIFVGLIGMTDPPRPEVPKAIALCKQAGIRVIVVTGDDKDTALAVSRHIGLYSGGDVVLGEEINELSDGKLAELVKTTEIFARVSPEHKMRIVDALKMNREVVGTTGDGVNDAPALKAADIGVAMGIKGTDVAKEASDMVLKDDNFATIVDAVKEGRRIYSNVKKFVRHLLSCNFGEVLVIFVASLIGLPLPLIAVQILLMNLLTDGLPALALGVDPAERGVMRMPPRKPGEHTIDKRMIGHIALVGLVMCVGVLGLFVWATRSGLPLVGARSVAFTSIVAFQLFNVFNARSVHQSAFRSGAPSGWLFAAVASSALIQLAVVYLEPLQKLFGTASLSVGWLGWCVLVAASVVVVVEGEKFLVRKLSKNL